jgi:hypothetical protein
MKKIAFALAFMLMASGAMFGVTNQVAADYISCLVSTGTDTTTLEQPLSPVNGLCQFLGLNVALEQQSCLACLNNTMQTLPAGDPGAFGAVPACFAGAGAKLSHQGQPGLLILSKRPLTSVQDVDFDTYSIRRVNVYATINGVQFAFTHWPTNYFYDTDPELGPLQTGALQPDLAEDVITHNPGVVLGDFNSGPDYQPDGYNLLVNNKYRPLFSQPTYCPPDHAAFPPCGDFDAKPSSIDNIFLKQNTGVCVKGTFGNQPVSDHVGLESVCVLKAQPQSKHAPSLTIMSMGTWNTMLEPWLPYESQVDAVLAKTNLDVLVLQAVWTPAAKDHILAAVKKKYPYSHYVAPKQQAGQCPFTPE